MACENEASRRTCPADVDDAATLDVRTEIAERLDDRAGRSESQTLAIVNDHDNVDEQGSRPGSLTLTGLSGRTSPPRGPPGHRWHVTQARTHERATDPPVHRPAEPPPGRPAGVPARRFGQGVGEDPRG